MSIAENKEQNIEQVDIPTAAGRVEIVYYTDPLCCWSWAFEPLWRRFRYEFGRYISWRYCMGGLLPDWNSYNDPTHSVSRPIQMGPVWMHASHISGMPIQSRIWMEDPPASSYPACIGVKCAEMQSKEAGEKYLRLLREAVMMEGRNIAKHDILIEQAEKLNIHLNAFNLNLFKHDIKGDKAIEAFRTDLNEVKYRSIDRFPTLIFRAKGQPSVIITGYRHYEILSSIMYKMIPGIIRESLPLDKDVYKETWGSITQRELNECYSTPLS